MNKTYAYGPVFTWFAWRPVYTADRGWRWLVHTSRVARTTYTNAGSVYEEVYRDFITTVAPMYVYNGELHVTREMNF